MQLGFNTNIRYQAVQFHVQTEDSGSARPHVITHLYHKGVILASEKREYAHLVGRATYLGRDVIDFVTDEGIEALEDFWEDLDMIEGMTNMEQVSQQPFPVAGVWSNREPRSFLVPPAESGPSGAHPGGSGSHKSVGAQLAAWGASMGAPRV